MDRAEPVAGEAATGVEAFSLDDVPRLTRGLQRGEEAAFAWLHGAWSGRINRYCFALAGGDDCFAGEIAQAVWLRTVRHIRPLKDERMLWNWLACAARHAAIDLRRKGGRYRRALGRFAEWWSRPAYSAEANEDAGEALIEALEAALKHLKPEEEALLEARYFASESLETIAARHSLTVRAVEGRLARLRKRLRQRIARELESPHS